LCDCHFTCIEKYRLYWKQLDWVRTENFWPTNSLPSNHSTGTIGDKTLHDHCFCPVPSQCVSLSRDEPAGIHTTLAVPSCCQHYRYTPCSHCCGGNGPVSGGHDIKMKHTPFQAERFPFTVLVPRINHYTTTSHYTTPPLST